MHYSAAWGERERERGRERERERERERDRETERQRDRDRKTERQRDRERERERERKLRDVFIMTESSAIGSPRSSTPESTFNPSWETVQFLRS